MCKDTCSIRISMEEENKDVEEEINSAKADTTKTNHENTTSTTGKTFQMHPEKWKQPCRTRPTNNSILCGYHGKFGHYGKK